MKRSACAAALFCTLGAQVGCSRPEATCAAPETTQTLVSIILDQAAAITSYYTGEGVGRHETAREGLERVNSTDVLKIENITLESVDSDTKAVTCGATLRVLYSTALISALGGAPIQREWRSIDVRYQVKRSAQRQGNIIAIVVPEAIVDAVPNWLFDPQINPSTIKSRRASDRSESVQAPPSPEQGPASIEPTPDPGSPDANPSNDAPASAAQSSPQEVSQWH